MALRDTQDALIIEAGLTGHLRVTQDVLIMETAVTGSGHLRDTQDVLIFEIPFPSSMAITYPLTPPAITGIGPQDIVMRMTNVVGETESPFTLNQQIQQWPGDEFQVDANLPPLPLAQGEQWTAFLLSLFGKVGTCLMGDYNRRTPQGPMSGSPVVSGTNLNGLNVLNVRGAAAGIANWAVAGDYVQVTSAGGPQRMYKVLQNASTDGSGNVTLQIRPNLRETLVDGLTIVTTNCACLMRLRENPTEWKIDRNRVYGISFKMKEAF